MFGLLRKSWMPLLLVVVVAVGAFVIGRIRESAVTATPTAAAGSVITANFNPKHVTYEVTGFGGMATVNYLDENGQPNLVETTPLPWSHTIVTTLPSMSANILVQGERDVRDLACRVTVDGDVRDDRSSSDSIKPFIYCLVKSV